MVLQKNRTNRMYAHTHRHTHTQTHTHTHTHILSGFPGGSDGKEFTCNAGDPGSISGLGISPREWEWQSTPVFLPGEFHGQRSLAGYSLWGLKESDTTEKLTHTHSP